MPSDAPNGAAQGNNNRWVDTGVFNADLTHQFGAELAFNYNEFNVTAEWIGALNQNAKVAGNGSLTADCSRLRSSSASSESRPTSLRPCCASRE